MALAVRLSSKFNSCPRSFVSRPTVHLSDNLSAMDIISSDIPAAARGLFTKYAIRTCSALQAHFFNKSPFGDLHF